MRQCSNVLILIFQGSLTQLEQRARPERLSRTNKPCHRAGWKGTSIGMGTYEKSITVAVPSGRLFSYLADVENLPAYLPRLTAARPQGGDRVTVTAHIDPPDGPEQDVTSDAFITVTEEGKSLEWGSPGPNDYRGRLRITAGDESSAQLTVELHTESAEGRSVEDGLEEALRGIKNAVEKAEH